jgi:predicted O-methyltransferase YrrM
MDAQVRQVLDEYERRAAEEGRLMQSLPEQEAMKRLDDFLLPVGPETGTVLNLLIKSDRPRVILEVGTSYGFSTLYLAEAARECGAKLVTLELSATKISYARDALTRAGLAQGVEFRQGNALDTLRALPGPFDFVLIDLWKDLYVPCLELIHPKLGEGAIIVADNMTYPESSRAEASAYRRRVRELGLDSVLLPLGSGIEISRRRQAV